MKQYIPNKLNEIIGQDTSKIIKWLDNPKRKALLIHGPTGTGKTSAVYALADDKNFELLELNSSDLRNKEKIKNIIGTASQQQSLFGKNKLILIDEVDGISGRHDYGGLAELNKIIENSKHPIILTGNEISDSKFKTLRKKCEMLEFKSVDYLDIFELLKKICSQNEVKFDEMFLKNLARKNNGDVRASLLDFERSLVNGILQESDDEREYKENIEDGLRLIFKSKDVKVLLNAFNRVDMSPDEILLWIDENLPREYSEDDLRKAYDMLAKADVYKGRILRRQYYRYLVYQSALMNVGVGLSKKKKQKGFIAYKRPERILKMWISKQRNAKRKSIMEKFAQKTHISKKKSYQEFGFSVNFLKDTEVSNELELDESEVEWLNEN